MEDEARTALVERKLPTGETAIGQKGDVYSELTPQLVEDIAQTIPSILAGGLLGGGLLHSIKKRTPWGLLPASLAGIYLTQKHLKGEPQV